MKPPLVTNARRILNTLTAAILDEWVKLYRMDKFVGPIEAVRTMAEEIRTSRQAEADRKRDYEDMRRFQALYIAADQERGELRVDVARLGDVVASQSLTVQRLREELELV